MGTLLPTRYTNIVLFEVATKYSISLALLPDQCSTFPTLLASSGELVGELSMPCLHFDALD